MGKRALVLAIALLLAAVSAFAVYRYTSGVRNEILAGQEQVPVFRATVQIAEGTTGQQILSAATSYYTESTDEVKDIPVDAITSQDELNQILKDRVAVGPMSPNQIFTRSQWAVLSVQITPLVDLIDSGLEAVTVSPDAISGVNGFVRPGDKVNILVTLPIEFDLTAIGQSPEFGVPTEQPTDGTQGQQQTQQVTYTRYVLTEVPVIAVGRNVAPKDDAPAEVTVDPGTGQAAEGDQGTVQGGDQAATEINTTYTLALPPEEIERLVFAQSEGSLYFTLIPTDYVFTETKGVTIQTLFEGNLVQDIFGNN